jgi:hypothetical protein
VEVVVMTLTLLIATFSKVVGGWAVGVLDAAALYCGLQDVGAALGGADEFGSQW